MAKPSKELGQKALCLFLLIVAIASLNIFIGNRQSAYAGIQIKSLNSPEQSTELARYELAKNSEGLESIPHSAIEPQSEQSIRSVPAAPAPRDAIQVVIDAGHGGIDGGTTGHDQVEKNWTLPLAISLARELRMRGVRVSMTRESDTKLSLEDRVRFANKIGSPLFVSLHLNNSSSPEVHGIETFYSWPKTMGTQAAIRRQLGLKPGAPVEDPGNEALAMEVQRRICKATGARNRGIKKTKLYVNRFTTGPAILVECGFLSNAGECKKITTLAYRNKMVKGIADGICFSLDSGGHTLSSVAQAGANR